MTISAECPVCGNPQAQGLLDDACTTLLERELCDVAAIVEDIDVTLSKQARIGQHSGPGGLARERTPINIGAMQVGDVLANVLTAWARDLYEDDEPFSQSSRPAVTATWVLLSNIPAIRRHPAVVKLVDEILDAIRQARRVVDRPADRMFVGPCMAETSDDEGRKVTCLEDLYARPKAPTVQCRVCSSEHDVAERRVWLLDQARDRLFTVREAAQMVGAVGGITVTEDRIRGYLRRGRIIYHPIGTGRGIRLGDLLAVIVDDSEKRTA